MAIATKPDRPDKPADATPAAPPRQYNALAGVLSYLVPGLGQIVQGRVGKGLLFLACVYALFFYGLFLGSGSARIEVNGAPRDYHVSGSVYLPDTYDERVNSKPRIVVNLYNRPQFIGQFCAGAVVWPAVWQYLRYDRTQPDRPDPLFGHFMRQPSDEDLNAVNTSNDKSIDLGWVFTVIAGVLNVMVIYDAVAGPAFPTPAPSKTDGRDEHPPA
jgi:hypothetical protein